MMKKNIVFFFLFSFLGFLALQIPFTRLLGSKATFTLFDFLAPIAGAFLGTLPGIASVFTIQLVNILLKGTVDMGNVIRLFPVLFAVFVFAKRRTVNLLIPLFCIAAFNLHPIGRLAWQFSLLWTIPLIAHMFRNNLLLRSLGATFTAHAVGGALWVWTFGLSREIWLALIPQVLLERTLFAGGITLSYILVKNLLPVLQTLLIPTTLHKAKRK